MLLLLLQEMRRTLQRWQQELHWTQQRLPRCILFSLAVHHPWIHLLRFFTINDQKEKKICRKLKGFHESLWVLIIPLICLQFSPFVSVGYRLDQIWNWRRRRRQKLNSLVGHICFVWAYSPLLLSEPIYKS